MATEIPASSSEAGLPWRTAVAGAAVILLGPWMFALLDSWGPSGTKWALVQLVLVNPLVFIIGSARSWVRYGWKSIVTVLVFAVATLISIYTVYNDSALVYLIAYLVLSAISIGIAALIVSLSNRSPRPEPGR